MSVSNPMRTRNLLLASLSERSWQRINLLLIPVLLPKDFLIALKKEQVEYVYFPESGVGSVTLETDGVVAEAGVFGRDGFSPTVAAVGGDVSMHDIVVQIPGDGHRIDREALTELLDQDRELERVLTRFAHNFATQVSYTALSNAANKIDVRLARWLLMCHDRVDGNGFHLTHEYLAVMLAVRRPSVTDALHILEGNGFIHSTRNHIHIVDREGLEAFAGASYGSPEQEYRTLMGTDTQGNSGKVKDGREQHLSGASSKA
ncbi:Crp/Fnr family transcriptional regulator [Pararhizobium qamdonense]|uniref:Crp/Fnr family transcriptional regulator n=1 Tax=Pararhizobium qamdonense TaxID=3031126 RepID=UPI0023E13B53|nr:Crp/Fnr family transcriptional regulator [Pararhizobium qamdonense]